MPTIPLGPNYQSFSDVAHQLEAERQAQLQLALQRDRLNADVENQRQEMFFRQNANVFNQQKADQDQALQMFRAETDRNMRQMEQERLQQGQEQQFNANNFKRAVETGVMMDETGEKYIPITEEEHPELYKARQDWLTEKNKADERLREQARQAAAEHVSAQQLNYLKAGFKLEQTTDEAGNPRIVSRPLNAQDPEWGWWQEQQQMAKDKIITPEERIAIERAKYEGREPEREAKAQKAAQDRYDKLDKRVSEEQAALDRLEATFAREWGEREVPSEEAEQALKDQIQKLYKDAGSRPSDKEAKGIKDAENKLKWYLGDKAKYAKWQARLEDQGGRVEDLKSKRDAANPQGEAGAGAGPNLSPEDITDASKAFADEIGATMGRDRRAAYAFWPHVNNGTMDSAEAVAAFNALPPEQKIRLAKFLRKQGKI